MPPELLSTEEAAALLRMHPKRVQQLARSGKLPAIRHGRRWLFRHDALVRRSPPPVAASPDGAELGIDLSARNQLRGVVRRVESDGLMAEVTIWIEPQELVAVITRSSADRLGLVDGAQAIAVVKSTEVMVARRHQQTAARRTRKRRSTKR
jgi:molybdopterin-binding protein